MKRPPFSRSEKQGAALLLLLCLLPVGVAGFIERRAARPVPAPIKVSAKTLANYTGVVPLGGSGYVRLGEQWEQEQKEEEEGVWSIYVHDALRDIEAHPDTPQGWKVEFVEELPDWATSGARTIGVRVTIPKSARQAIENGATAGLFHTRDGVQHYFSESFQVAPHKTHGKATFNSRAGFRNQRAHSSPPSR